MVGSSLNHQGVLPGPEIGAKYREGDEVTGILDVVMKGSGHPIPHSLKQL